MMKLSQREWAFRTHKTCWLAKKVISKVSVEVSKITVMLNM